MSELNEETAQKLIAELSANRAMLGEVLQKMENQNKLMFDLSQQMVELYKIEDFIAKNFADYIKTSGTWNVIGDLASKFLHGK